MSFPGSPDSGRGGVPGRPAPLRVLIVEDEPAHAELMIRELGRAGFAPSWRRVQTEAEYLEHLVPPPDVILCDYSLPQFDANRALQLLQNRGLDVPFIVVSGTMGEETAVDLMTRGAADYLLKDRLTRLGQSVEQALAQRRLRDEKRQADDRVRSSEERYRTLFEGVPVGLFRTTPAGKIIEVNAAYLRMLGYPDLETLLAAGAGSLYVDPAVRSRLVAQLERDGELTDYDSQLRRYDGGVIWVRANVRALRDSSGRTQYFEGAIVDITERKQTEEVMWRQFEELTALYSSAKQLSSSLDLNEQAADVVRTCVEAFGAHLAWLARFDPGLPPRLLAQYPLDVEHPRRLFGGVWKDYLRTAGVLSRALDTGAPQIIDDITKVSNPPPWQVAVVDLGLRSVGAFPLVTRGKPFGLLMLYSPEPGIFGPERVEFFQAYASQAAAALEHARLFEHAERRLQRLQALHEIDTAINSSRDLHITLEVLVEKVLTQLHVDAVTLLLLNPATATLDYAAGRGFQTRALQHTRLPVGASLAGRAARDRTLVSVPNLSEDPGEFSRSPALSEEGVVAYYAVPLIANEQVKGVLEVFNRSPLEPDHDWLDFLHALASQAAIAIDSASMFTELQRSNADLVLSYDTTLVGWSRALELRDKETEGHTQRVADLTVRLARAVGVPEDELVHIRRGALLHDIGKMGVPDSILRKPDPLDDDEWKIMRRHPAHAYEWLAPISFLRPALDIPYCHHEKWDGSGYPRGLKAEQIPVAARIFAVADVWDALRSDRPYRPAWSEAKARTYIRRQAGRHFDPRVVDVFLAMMSEAPAEAAPVDALHVEPGGRD